MKSRRIAARATRTAHQAFVLLALALLVLMALPVGNASAAEGILKAGAARVDITPPVAELPAPFRTIHDPLYVRALILDNGSTRAAIVIADVPTIAAGIHADLLQRISRQASVPVEHILLGGTHTHNSIRVDVDGPGLSIAGSQKFADRVVAASLEAVQRATAGLQPARAGYATGEARLIAGRNQWDPVLHRYIDGIDRTGADPVDRTLGVMRIESLSGEPIAFVLNYAIEPVVAMGTPTEIGGDVPGSASRYIEKVADKAVAIFTIGPNGSPLYRVMAGAPGGVVDAERVRGIVSAMGTILGEEALAAARDIREPQSSLRISGATHVLECPGKITTPLNLPNQCAYTPDSRLPACDFKDKDTEPVDVHMGMLRIGDVAMVQADANVSAALGAKLKRASPLAATLIVALTFGPARFLVDDASYPLNTYEATATRLKQGCAEQGFVDGALKMLQGQ